MILLWSSAEMTCQLVLVDKAHQYAYEWEAGRSLAHDMLGYVRDRLAEHQASFHDITAIGVLRGPGSFTGLRIGLTVCNTLAESLAVPIVGVVGSDWQAMALDRLSRGDNDRIVLPEYGSEAHITSPRK